MNEAQIKALIRDSVRRQLEARSSPVDAASARSSPAPVVAAAHVSHDVYVTLVNAGEACLIEPGVPCTHCNYCKSHGH